MKWIQTKIETLILSGNALYIFFLLFSINLLFVFLISEHNYNEISNNSLQGKNAVYIPVNLIKYKKSTSKQQIKKEDLTKNQTSSPQVGSEGELKDSYIARILYKIEKNKRYPKIEQIMERQGYVKIHLELNKNGQIVHINVIEGTNENFINEALRTIQQSAPFEPIPEELGHHLSILINLKFILE